MTYQELLDKLQAMTQEQLGMDVTVHSYTMDETFAVAQLFFADKDSDVLDEDHPVLGF